MKLKTFFLPLLLLVATLLPKLALADTVTPAGATAWDLYVFGNGYVVEQILWGVKTLMVGHSSAFTTLLLFMATLGFISLAIAAGFDPGKNLLRMFTYIISVWMVTYGSTSLTANVVIIDTVQSSTSGAPDYYVADVPALVALPAALTSQVGIKFTEFLEQHFSTVEDPAFTLSGSGGGQFNLKNRMLQESSQFRIEDAALKRTLGAYSTNCVIPAIALGKLVGQNGKGEAVYGVKALTENADYLATLSSAASAAVLTPYYPYKPQDTAWATGMDEFAGASEADIKQAGAAGALVSCYSAFNAIMKDVQDHAASLIATGANAWAKAGVSVGFEEAYKRMLAQASAPGNSMGSPTSYIMQQSMMNTMSGTFRQAAAQTGNNELLQAVALTQAEVQQKSTWVAGFSLFNNMMGYVFCVLQALIFALTPIIVVALMIPGMGKTIFVNYGQILVWLTLWTPMLAIVNFIITMFGSKEFAEAVAGGLSPMTQGAVSERANNLVIAAQFLGTMVPMLTWGIVKGAMAFTEFITHGVGANLAGQAGAAAATGNISMGNVGLNSTSMDKYSTQMQSAVGFQEVAVGTNAGALNVSQAQGGGTVSRNGSTVDTKQAMQDAISDQISKSEALSHELGSSMGKSLTVADLLSKAADSSKGVASQQAAMTVLANAISASTGMGHGQAMALVQSAAKEESGQASTNTGAQGHVGVSGEMQFGGAAGQAVKFLSGASAKIDAGGKLSKSLDNSTSISGRNGKGLTDTEQAELRKVGLSEQHLRNLQDTITKSASTSNNSSTRASHDEGAVLSRAASEAYKESLSITSNLSAMKSVTSSYGWANENDMAAFEQRKADIMAMASGMGGREGLEQQRDRLLSQVKGDRAQIEGAYSQQVAKNQAAAAQLHGAANGRVAPVTKGVEQAIGDTRKEIVSANAAAQVRADGLRGEAAGIRERAGEAYLIPGSKTYVAKGDPKDRPNQPDARFQQAAGMVPMP